MASASFHRGRAEQGPGADGCQRPLLRRSRLQPQLRPGVRLPLREKNCTLYSGGKQDYTAGIRLMSGRQFLINPQQATCRGYYTGKNS
jgi:hypothetical protein